LSFPPGVHFYNYADKPDFSTAELVSLIHRALGRASPRVRLPFWMGLAGGYSCDFLAMLTGRAFSISSNRILKFCAATAVSTRRLHASGFVRPYALQDALVQTIQFEFGADVASR
jgi:hypothetical protein